VDGTLVANQSLRTIRRLDAKFRKEVAKSVGTGFDVPTKPPVVGRKGRKGRNGRKLVAEEVVVNA
jgi:hypothetical protein